MSLGNGGLGSGIFGSGGGFAVAGGGPPTTKWSFISAASGDNFTVAAATNFTVKPNVGDLMVLGGNASAFSGAPTSLTPTDTGSGGWTQVIALQTIATNVAKLWFKVALAADFNGGAGITVTMTQAGGSGGSLHTGAECDVFRLSSGTVSGFDLAAPASSASSLTTFSWSPASGSGQPSAVDELAYTIAFLRGFGNGPTGTNTFTGTSAATNLSATLAPANNTFYSAYATLVQASATAGTNVFVNTWTGAANNGIFLGATFYHS